MGFLTTLFIALTIHARIMRIWFCPGHKNIEVPKHFMAFLRTLFIVLTIHARTMGIWFFPLQIFAIN